MKFARLELKAFGPFTDRVIELADGSGRDCHVLFGPNEAGKSTILRAVSGFLFGIPERSGDAFVHDYGSLRIGATLELDGGGRLALMRRKARKASLFAVDEASGHEITDRPLPESTLLELLGGLDLALYHSLFGLDLEGLTAGGEELLRGEGEVGRSLFQAAAGLASLQGVGTALAEEAAAVFKPRGSTGRLNRALGEAAEQRRVVKERTVRSSAWLAAERSLSQAEAASRQKREDLKGARTGLQTLERIRANLPLVAERAAKQDELAALARIPVLSADAAQRRVAAQERLRSATRAETTAREMLTQRRSELEGLVAQPELLARAGAIEQLFHQVADYRGACEALPRLRERRVEQTGRITALLARIAPGCPPGQAAELLPAETLVARVHTLVEEHAQLGTIAEQLEAQLRAREMVLEGLQRRLAALPDPVPADDLEAALAEHADLPQLETRRGRLAGEIAELEDRLRREAATLSGGGLDALVALAVPLPETAAEFEREFAALAQDERLLAEQTDSLVGELAERRRELGMLESTGEAVTQAEVAAARGDRDRRWLQVRARLLGQPAEAPAGAQAPAPDALAGGFEQALREADRVADLLHADSQRAAQLESTRRRLVEVGDRQQQGARQQARLAARREELERRWRALVVPLGRSELTPGALREWLPRHRRLVDEHAALGARRAGHGALVREISQARAGLEQAMGSCAVAARAEEHPVALLGRARRAVDAARQVRADREATAERIAAAGDERRDLQLQLQRVCAKLAEWRGNWSSTAEQLGLPADALPAEARARLDQFAELAEALGELARIEAEERARQVSAGAFESAAEEIRAALPGLADAEDPGLFAGRSYALLGEARRAEARHQRLAGEIEREQESLARSQLDVRDADEQLTELCREAGDCSTEELPAIEAKAARKQALAQRLFEIDEQLVLHNARPVDEVLDEAAGFDLDGLARRIDDAGAAIDERERQLEAAQAATIEAQREFDRIDGGTEAAEAQQALASLHATIAGEARAYVRARLAGILLERVVQSYRERHQGPLVERAAALFARITLGSFASLRVDYLDGRQVLLGVRGDGAAVPVAGMSQGTRDQLFLSLRIAAIERHVDGRGPMPVIIDDLLVQFDDERALAALEVLVELSRRTQVLFFTHHRHLVELAADSKLGSALVLHRIERGVA